MSAERTDPTHGRRDQSAQRPPKPTPLAVKPNQIPAELVAPPQWCCWRYEWRDSPNNPRGGDWTKPPFNAATGGHAQSNNPATHTGFLTALNAYRDDQKGFDGIGFAFHDGDGLVGIDLDHVVNMATGELSPDAAAIVEAFRGTYCEISPSGDGVRIFAKGSPGRSGKNKDKVKWLEVYAHPSHRYLTVTGHHLPGTATEVTEQQDALNWLHASFFVEEKQEPPRHERRTADYSTDDTALLDKARTAHNGDRFAALFDRGDTSAYGDDDSSADLALCNLLAFWCNCDADRMDRLFRQSALMRDKWGRADYRQWTLDKAIAGCKETYGNRARGDGDHREREEPPPADDGDPGYSADDDQRRNDSRSNSSNSSRDSDPRVELSVRCLSDVHAKRLDWEWYPLLLRRASNLLVGDSDVGKTKALMRIVATVTRGGVYPGTVEEVPPRNVIMLCAEEDAETMIKPALIAAGADCNRVFLVESCAEYDSRGRMKRRLVTLEHDIETLTTMALQIGNVGVLSIDPVTAYLGTRVSGNENSAIRGILGGLQSFAETHGNANILLTHFNKDTSKSAKNMVIGSIAFTAGVRSVIGAFRDPGDETGARRLLIPMKCNLVPEQDRFGIAFEIHSVDVQDGDTSLPNVGVAVWIAGRVHKTADEVIAEQQSRFAETRDEKRGRGEERQRIIDVLRAAGRPLHAREIAEILEGEPIPSNSDKRRVRVRRLLSKMLAAGQVHQLETEEYTLDPDGGDHVEF